MERRERRRTEKEGEGGEGARERGRKGEREGEGETGGRERVCVWVLFHSSRSFANNSVLMERRRLRSCFE
jgi:hypothetical protein